MQIGPNKPDEGTSLGVITPFNVNRSKYVYHLIFTPWTEAKIGSVAYGKLSYSDQRLVLQAIIREAVLRFNICKAEIHFGKECAYHAHAILTSKSAIDAKAYRRFQKRVHTLYSKPKLNHDVVMYLKPVTTPHQLAQLKMYLSLEKNNEYGSVTVNNDIVNPLLE